MSDYTRKKGIAHTEIILPDNAHAEYKDRAVLWNAVEQVEKAKNIQLAREIEIALPVELSHMQNLNLVREYVKKNFVEHGMCADIAYMTIKKEIPMPISRPFNEDKTWGDKQKKVYQYDKNGNKIYDPKKRQYKCSKVQTTDWNEQTKAEDWRAAWTETANKYLKQSNHDKRIGHRSFARQGKEEIPTIHLGVAAHQMEQRGIQTERGNINRAIKFANQKLRNLKTQITELKTELETLLAEKITPPVTQAQPQEITTPPTATQPNQNTTPQPPTTAELNILDMLRNMLSDPQAKARVQRITSLSVVKSAVEFLEQYNITTLSKLQKTLAATEAKFDEVNEKTKTIEERLKKLNPLIKQADNYLQHREINKLYKQQKPKQKTSFTKPTAQN